MVCARPPASAAPPATTVVGPRVPVARVVPAPTGPGAPVGGPIGGLPGAPSGIAAGPAPTPPGSPATPTKVIAAIAGVVAVGLVVALVVLVSGGDDTTSVRVAEDRVVDEPASDRSSSDAPDATESEEPEVTRAESTTTEDRRPSTTRRQTTTTTEPTRSGTLFSGDAKVRSAPSLGATDVARLSGQQGASLEILGPPTRGWYQVRIGAVEGYLFGAFVLPPAPGYCVGTSVGAEPTVVDDSGSVLTDEKTGNKVLMTASQPTDGWWPVVLPGGRTGFVSTADLIVESCR